MGRQRNSLIYVVVEHIYGESGSPSVGAMCWAVTLSTKALEKCHMYPQALREATQTEATSMTHCVARITKRLCPSSCGCTCDE